jgi:hypothetical protein
MSKDHLHIEILVTANTGETSSILGEVQDLGEHHFACCVSSQFGTTKAKIHTCSLDTAIVFLSLELQRLLDANASEIAGVQVLSDPCSVLPKLSYRCANPACRAKLFESWGPAYGIRIVCRKCKHLGSPIMQNS